MDIMLSFWERVENLRKQSGLSRERLCEKIGISIRTYNGWIYKNVLPNIMVGSSLAHILEATSEYLVTGEELALPDDDYLVDKNPVVVTKKGPLLQNGEEPTILVPLAPQKISAGRGEEFLPPSEYSGYVRILERMAKGIDPLTLMAVTVKGDSMTGVQIFEGDVVIFARNHISENGIYIISLYGDLKVKRLEFRSGEQQIFIHSENSRYTMEVISMDSENLQILGKVVGWIHCHPY